MSGSKFISINPGVMTSNNDLQHIFKASSQFGGVTIIDAWFSNDAATDAGTSFHLYLLNYGTAGTALASGGTIGDCGGTASPFAAKTPKAFSLTAAQVFVDQDEWVVLRKTQEGADSDIAAQACLCIEYVDGIVTQG